MNHSGAFWKVRNAYASELKTLWAKGYTGEGLWSRGISLVSVQYERDGLDAGEIMPEHLCGGTFKSSGKRKKKPKEKPTYKEREARRIVKKFGTNGMTLGADEETKAKLEKGRRIDAKPRVAGSARGRELRAAAALARFETKKEESDKQDENETVSETESEDDGDLIAVDINGKKLLDKNGRGMVKVCEDEDKSDPEARNEMSEPRSFDIKSWASSSKLSNANKTASRLTITKSSDVTESYMPAAEISQEQRTGSGKGGLKPPQPPEHQAVQKPSEFIGTCPVCSMENDAMAPTCPACANVLDPARVPSIWHCQSDICKGGKYVNAGDCGVCGVCGARKCSNGI
jgi:DNA-dependent metalloprotease WSS1